MAKIFQICSVSAVDWQHLPTARILDQYNCLLLPMLAQRLALSATVPPPLLANILLFGRSLEICLAPAVATALQASSRCRHRHCRRYSRRARSAITAVAITTADELTCQQLLAVAATGLPLQAQFTAIATTQACLPSAAPRCRQADFPWQPSTPLLDTCLEASYSLPTPTPPLLSLQVRHSDQGFLLWLSIADFAATTMAGNKLLPTPTPMMGPHDAPYPLSLSLSLSLYLPPSLSSFVASSSQRSGRSSP